MFASGINLTLRIGERQPEPAPRLFIEALQSVEVTHSDQGRSGFQMVFAIGRQGRPDLRDYQLIQNPLLQPFNRVIITVTINMIPHLLIDGVITNQQLSPSIEPGQSTFTLTGEDVSAMMDLEERSIEHPQQNAQTIVEQLLSRPSYSQYRLIADVARPPIVDPPARRERIPVQQGTDLSYINNLAQRYAYVFYITPGPKSGTNTAYWGPPKRGQGNNPQRALTVNMGPFTNINSLSIQGNALAAMRVEGQLQDRQTNQIRPVVIDSSTRPSLARRSPLGPGRRSQSHVRVTQFRETGRTMTQAQAQAQATVDRSTDDVITVSGELDTLRYGDLLQLRGLVGLRGVGYNFDGLYYVKSVTHNIRLGEYKQSFTITRNGVESNVQRLSV